ncbi:MAG: hypothetical protein ACR2JE_18080 [Acidobacteriaceae bacterium]
MCRTCFGVLWRDCGYSAINEVQIRALIEDRIHAIRAKDVEQATANIAPDILSAERSFIHSAISNKVCGPKGKRVPVTAD